MAAWSFEETKQLVADHRFFVGLYQHGAHGSVTEWYADEGDPTELPGVIATGSSSSTRSSSHLTDADVE